MVEVWLQWWDQQEIQIDFLELMFESVEMESGRGSIKVDKDLLDVIIPGMKVIIKEDGVDDWLGRMGLMRDNGDGTLTFDMVDEWGKLLDRKIDFRSAGFTGSPGDTIVAVEASAMLVQLFKTYTGESSTDSAYNVTKYVVPSRTTRVWDLLSMSFAEGIKRLANTSAIESTSIGFTCWLDGSKNVHFEPLGYGARHEDKLYEIRNIQFSMDHIVNSIRLRANNPPSKPPDRDYYTEDGSLTITTYWRNTVTSGSAIVAAAPVGAMLGTTAVRCYISAPGGPEYAQFAFDIDSASSALSGTKDDPGTDWSDGEGTDPKAMPRRATHLEDSGNRGSGNFVLDYVEFMCKWSSDTDGKEEVDWNIGGGDFPPELRVYIVTNNGADNFDVRTASKPNDWIRCHELSANKYPTAKAWVRTVWYPKPLSTDTSVDVTDIDHLIISLHSSSAIPPTGGASYFWIDGLQFHFREIDLTVKDESSAVRWDLKEAYVQSRNIRDWEQAYSVARGLLASRKDPSISGNAVQLPYDPSVQINDIVPVTFHGKVRDMIVRSRTINVDKNGARMTLKLGDRVPTTEAMIEAMHLKQVEDQSDGSGYKREMTYDSSACYELCEVDCEEECLLDLDQTETGKLTSREDPCMEDCQTLAEL